jgi:hypothetical protein
MKSRIKEYIKFNKLDDADRHQAKNYKRIILAALLKQEGETMQTIGRMFKRHHATVINMLKNYEFLSNYSDFRELEYKIKEEIEFYTLEEKILKVDNMADLHWLQEEVKKSLNS